MTRRTLISGILLILVITFAAIRYGWTQIREVSLRQLQQAVQNNPNDPRLHYLLGLKYQNEGKTRQAFEAYQRALALNPKYSEALLGLGALKFAQGDQAGAIQVFQKAVRLDPKNEEAKILLGTVYGRQGLALLEHGKTAEAAKVLQLAVANSPKDDIAFNNLGVALAAQGDLIPATQAFQQAIRANPANDGAHFNLGYTYLSTGDKTRALDQYAALTVLNSGYGGELFALMSYPKGYPVDIPYSPPQWGQTRPYKALPAPEMPSTPNIADALRGSPDLQIHSYESSVPAGQKPAGELGRIPGLQTPSYQGPLPGGRLPDSQMR